MSELIQKKAISDVVNIVYNVVFGGVSTAAPSKNRNVLYRHYDGEHEVKGSRSSIPHRPCCGEEGAQRRNAIPSYFPRRSAVYRVRQPYRKMECPEPRTRSKCRVCAECQGLLGTFFFSLRC